MKDTGHGPARCDDCGELEADIEHRDDPRLIECTKRLRYVRDCLALAYEHLAGTGSFNESLRALGAALQSSRPRPRKRLHPCLELAISDRWWRRQQEDPALAGSAPNAAELTSIVDEIAEQLRPFRGRPPLSLVRYHVCGLMVLIREATGHFPKASPTSNSVYDRRMTTKGGRLIVQLVQGVDPSISEGTLAGFLNDARQSGELEGKRFRDFYPFYGSRGDPATGRPVLAPGMRLQAFAPVFPIYIS